MPDRTQPPGQLDIPLVWAADPASEMRGPAPTERPSPAPPSRQASAFRLWGATLADLLITAAAAAVAVGVAAALLGGVSPAGAALAALAGLETTAVIAVGCLWGWRGTPGMLAAGVCFARPIPFGRACTMWGVWLLSLPLAGVPLVVRVRGESAAERLAGGALSSRSLPAGA